MTTNRWLALVPPLALMGLIWFLSSLPGTATPGTVNPVLWISPTVQNFVHIPVYAVLALSVRNAARRWGLVAVVATVTAIVVATGYGALDEWHQLHVPGRFASVGDATFNLVGSALGAWLHARRDPRRTPDSR